jgi:hypothetical protein
VDAFNAIVATVADQDSSFVTVLNTYNLLDPNGTYTTDVNGVVARTPDGVHITQAGVQDVLDGTLDQMINSVGPPIYNGTA